MLTIRESETPLSAFGTLHRKYHRHRPLSPYNLRNIFLVIATVRKRFGDSSGREERGEIIACIT